jgi:dTDP-4-amino-4,6-dideoxygalactose transaminase
MKVPFLDLVTQYHSLRDELLPAMGRVMESAQFILGDEVELFEDKFAAYCGTDHCVGVSSGTAALHLALRALGIGPGDEVITSANTFAATPFAIAYTGASPVFVDVTPDDYNLDVELLEQAVTERTKAIIPVHLYGQPAQMEPILELARKYDLRIVEDACQAHGAEYHKRPAGSLGDVGCFSFYPGKNLGAYGDGGAIVTSNQELAERIRLLRNYGQVTKNVHAMMGYNSRLDTLQAAILLVKLNRLEQWTECRRSNAQRYQEALANANVVLPRENAGVRHVYHLFVIRHPQRDALLKHLAAQGIACGIHYPHPIAHAAPFDSARRVPEGVPVATALSQTILSLPMYPELTPEQINAVASAVESFTTCAVSV